MDFILDFFVKFTIKTWLLWLQELYCKKYWDISHWKFCKILGIPSFTLIYRCHKIMWIFTQVLFCWKIKRDIERERERKRESEKWRDIERENIDCSRDRTFSGWS